MSKLLSSLVRYFPVTFTPLPLNFTRFLSTANTTPSLAVTSDNDVDLSAMEAIRRSHTAHTLSQQPPKLFFHFTKNNIFCHLEIQDRIVHTMSCGTLGYKNSAKLSQACVMDLLDRVQSQLQQRGILGIRLETRGANMMQSACLSGLRARKVLIVERLETTMVPHNGPRRKKPRRV